MNMEVTGEEINHESLPMFARNKHLIFTVIMYDEFGQPYNATYEAVVNEKGTTIIEQLIEARNIINEREGLSLTAQDLISWEVKYTRNVGNTMTVILGALQRAREVIIEQNQKINALESIQQQQLACWDLTTQNEIISCMRNIE